MYWVGFPLAIAISLFLVPAGARGLRDAGLARENYRGAGRVPGGGGARRLLAGGAGAAGRPRRPGRPRPARPGLRRGWPTCSGSRCWACSTTRSAGARRRRAPRLARARAALLAGAPLDRGDQGGRGAGPRRLRVSGRGLDRGASRRRRAAAPRHQPRQPARPAAGAGGEGAGAARRGSASEPGPSSRSSCSGSSPARSWSAPGSPCGSGRCSATPART